jgi:glycosyltransferase involved in cell wall biosynthesis
VRKDPAIPARPDIAVVIPCYNEALTIANVIAEFREQLPEAVIYVFDNNSSDSTSDEARKAGAIVISERRQGKGYVVQSMFQKVDADVYVMVDGDGTYPGSSVKQLVGPVLEDEADMVIGSRLHAQSHSQFKVLNLFGNTFYLALLNWMFNARLTDLLSGYRAFSRRFVKSIPLSGGGFEIEAELTIKALERGFRILDVPVDLGERPKGSHSKIRWVRDGILILNTILALFRDYKPLTFFGASGLLLSTVAAVAALTVAFGFRGQASDVKLLATVLSSGLFLAGVLLIVVGLVLHTIVRRFQEFDHYLNLAYDRTRGHDRNFPAVPSMLEGVGRKEEDRDWSTTARGPASPGDLATESSRGVVRRA